MSLRHFPATLDKYALAHGDEAELPDWMQYAACMLAVSEETGAYTEADTLTLHHMRHPRAELPADVHPDTPDRHRANFEGVVDYIMAFLTARGGVMMQDGPTLYNADEIADILSEDNPLVTPSHVRAAQREKR